MAGMTDPLASDGRGDEAEGSGGEEQDGGRFGRGGGGGLRRDGQIVVVRPLQRGVCDVDEAVGTNVELCGVQQVARCAGLAEERDERRRRQADFVVW